MTLNAAARQTLALWASPAHWPNWATKFVSSKLPVVVTLALILAIAHSLAGVTWNLLEPPPLLAVSPTSRAPGGSISGPQASGPAEYDRIANLHLFGSPAQRDSAPVSTVSAPDTSLNLTLHGVFVDEDPKQGAAIIGRAGGDQKFYRVGDGVPGGATLAEVRADQVILSRNGRYEALRFPRTEKLAVPSSPAPSGAASLAPYRAAFVKEPQKILDYIQIVPQRQGSAIAGYRVLPQKGHETFYNQLGLKLSDVVTGINGIPVTDPREAMKLMSELTNANQLTLDVVRGGRSDTITIDLR
jgi:general secretion pathway protein C